MTTLTATIAPDSATPRGHEPGGIRVDIGLDLPPVTRGMLRPLVGGGIVVRTRREMLRGTLVSCVSTSAWLVVDDTDRVVPLDDMIAVWAR